LLLLLCPAGEAPRMLRASENFAFLSRTDAQLARLGALAEWSLHVDPPTTIQKLRIFTEVLARFVAARQGALPVPNEAFADLLVRLQRSRLLQPSGQRSHT
jgi:type I restriction enzyme R subunit